jgi:hypothetical protein
MTIDLSETTMRDLTTLPGANIALNVIALLPYGDGIIEDFRFKHTEHRWNQEARRHDPAEPHFEVYADCSDTFFWGISDAEEITEENFHILAESFAELAQLAAEDEAACDGSTRARVDAQMYTHSIADLFSARVRKERPQGAAYKVRYAERLWPLFNACGPERPIEFGNPKGIGQ